MPGSWSGTEVQTKSMSCPLQSISLAFAHNHAANELKDDTDDCSHDRAGNLVLNVVPRENEANRATCEHQLKQPDRVTYGASISICFLSP